MTSTLWRIFATVVLLAYTIYESCGAGIDWSTWLTGFVLGGLFVEWLTIAIRKAGGAHGE